MATWQRTYAAACAAMIGFAISYTMSDYGHWPRFTYFPYERQWRVVSTVPGPVPMNYLGTVAWGLSGAVVAAGLVWLASCWWRRELSKRALHMLGGWALLAFVYAGAYFTWNLWPF